MSKLKKVVRMIDTEQTLILNKQNDKFQSFSIYFIVILEKNNVT